MSIKWISSDDSFFIGKREIGSLFYVNESPRTVKSKTNRFNSCIDVSLPIGEVNYEPSKEDQGEFKKYCDLTPNERATYLNWLASPRTNPQCRSDFVRLYASGLEYRFFKDDSDKAEKLEIYKEVQRLSMCYGDRRRLEDLFGDFLDTAKAMNSPTKYFPKTKQKYSHRSYAAKIAFSKSIMERTPITAEGSLDWPNWELEARIEKRYYDCEKELVLLYKHLFKEKYPKGLIIKPPEKYITRRYSAKFGQYTTNIKFEVNDKHYLDISELEKYLKIFKSIANEAMGALAKLGKYRTRHPRRHNILDEMALVPNSIRHKIERDDLTELKGWLKYTLENGGFTVRGLYQELSCRRPKTLTSNRYREICDKFAKIGFGVTPDPRVTSPPPKYNEEIFVFPVRSAEDQSIGENIDLLADIMEICIGVYIALAIGDMTSEKTRAIQDVIDKKTNLMRIEREALAFNLRWFTKYPPKEQGFRKFFKIANESQKNRIRQTTINIAHATGASHTNVIARVEQVYKLIGLDSVVAYSDVQAGQIVDQPASKSLFAIDKEGAVGESTDGKSKRVKLDQQRIKLLSKETTEVKRLLTEIFSDEIVQVNAEKLAGEQSGSKQREKKKQSRTANKVFEGLETKYIPLILELLSKVRWTDNQVEKLASKQNLMWSGSLEVLNEWAFDMFGSELVEEYNGYQLNGDTVGKLTKRVQEFNR